MTQLSLLETVQLGKPGCSGPDAVAELAGALISELGLEPPIDPRVVASRQGIHKIELADLPWAGCLVPLGDQLIVKVREGDGRGRRRFTIFHEIGHTFMPGFSYQTQFRCDPEDAPTTEPTLERLCDQAASELLFPRAFVVPEVVRSSFDLDSVAQLAERYDASLLATAHKFVSLWPEDGLLLVMKRMTKPSETPDSDPALRVHSVHGKGKWPYIPRFKSIGSQHALQSTLDGDILDEPMNLQALSSTLPKKLHVSARSFPYRERGEMNDRVFVMIRKRSHRNRDGQA